MSQSDYFSYVHIGFKVSSQENECKKYHPKQVSSINLDEIDNYIEMFPFSVVTNSFS